MRTLFRAAAAVACACLVIGASRSTAGYAQVPQSQSDNYVTLRKTLDVTGDEVFEWQRITYTITVVSDRDTDYTFTDDLSAVLDDATMVTPEEDLARAGFVMPLPPNGKLNWTGGLKAGKPVILKYVLAVKPPGAGDRWLANVVFGEHSNCPPSNPYRAECRGGSPTKSLRVGQAPIAFSMTSVPADEVLEGDPVTYVVTVKNVTSAAVDYTWEADLKGVLDDAKMLTSTARLRTSGFQLNGTVLRWHGRVRPGSMQLSFQVGTRNPLPAESDHVLTALIIGPQSNCVSVGADPACQPNPVQVIHRSST